MFCFPRLFVHYKNNKNWFTLKIDVFEIHKELYMLPIKQNGDFNANNRNIRARVINRCFWFKM